MAKVIAGMTVSLDGFMDADRVNPDFDELRETAAFKKMIEDTGAVIMGRHTYEMADPMLWVNDDYEFQVPLFILTHTPPEKYPAGNGKISVKFVTDGIESAIVQAKEAADEKQVQIIGGADTIQQALNSRLCDELWLDVMPVLTGTGLRLFENIDNEKVKLERVSVEEITSMRTGIIYRLVK